MAGEVYAHRLVTGEDEPEARADEECRDKERRGRMAERKDKVRDNVQRHAGADEVNQVTAVDELARHDAVHDKPSRDKRVEPAGTSDAEFLGVERDVVGDGAVGETDEDEVHELRDGAREEKAVERKRGVGLLFFGGDLEGLHQNKSDDAERDGDDEYDGVAEGFVQEHAGHGAGSEREVHADAEVADAFTAAACRERVDGDSVARGRRNAEAKSVHKAQYRKERDEPERLVADKAESEGEERPKIERLAAESIDQESGEGPAGERTDGIERNDDARGRVIRMEFFDDEQREDRQQLVEAEEQQEVRCGASRKVPRPQGRLLCVVRHIKYPGDQR